jgi:hypothetical protein
MVSAQVRRRPVPRLRRSSCFFVQERLATLVGHLKADLGHLGAHLKHDPLDITPGRKIATRCTAHRQARQRGQRDTRNAVDQCIEFVTPNQFFPLLQQPQLQQLGLDLEMIGVSLRARRLLPFAPQVSQLGNAALIEREAATLPLDHTFGLELADVGSGCNRGAAPVLTR